MYNIHQLKKYANKFLLDNYGMTLTVPLKLNGRLKTTCGYFKHKRIFGHPISVELNKYFVENNEPTVVLDVLRHELVHYALYMQEKPYTDGHPVFEGELRKLGVVSQKTINKYEIKSKPKTMHIYVCENCSTTFRRQRALPNGGRNHICTCKGRLLDMGKKLVNS